MEERSRSWPRMNYYRVREVTVLSELKLAATFDLGESCFSKGAQASRYRR